MCIHIINMLTSPAASPKGLSHVRGRSLEWSRTSAGMLRTGCLRSVSCLRSPRGDFLFKSSPLNNNSCAVFRHYVKTHI